MTRQGSRIQEIREALEMLRDRYELEQGELYAAEFTYEEQQAEREEQLASLQVQADDLAREFKELYREASEAYEARSGALAKQFSNVGHEKQRECEDLNRQANELRAELSSAREDLNAQRRIVTNLRSEIGQLEKELFTLEEQRRAATAVRKGWVEFKGFEVLGAKMEGSVRGLVNSFPPALSRRVARITYRDIQAVSRSGSQLLGRTSKPRGQMLFEIEVFYHDRNSNVRETVAHELGHVAYTTLTNQEHQRWSSLYSSTDDSEFFSSHAMRDPEEDFGECVAWYKTNPQEFASQHREKYTFMQQLFGRLHKEQTK